ncbi:FecR domain-containing protein [uncultured Desulfobulbus sp.]|uniref:FecR domain-containing protein n=1 Tax=uncultured Desulfobulbus sp. TaxID=239745 RepID=UPI0026033901|nr:FecR domain-containing protein [uncultured Desulfobulbus sp.]
MNRCALALPMPMPKPRPAAPAPVRSALACLLFVLALFCLPGRVAAGAPAEVLIPIHVSAGTNLIHLARDYCRDRNDWRRIAALNKLTEPYLIIRDTTLQVPLSLLVAEPLTARVAAVNGPVSLHTADGRTSPLRQDDTVAAGQTVVTGPDGYTHLILPDNTYTRVEPEARFTIAYLFRLADGTIKADFTLDRGGLVHWVRQKLRANDTFQTRTPIAVTGIRGTEYRLKSEGSEANTVETLRGRVEVAAGGRNVGLAAGQGTRVRAGGTPERPRALPAAPAVETIEPLYRTLPMQIHTPAHATAKRFRLRLTSDDQGQATAADQVVAAGSAFTIGTLADGRYFAFLSALDAEGFESAPAGPRPLTLRTVPPAPLITAPQNNGSLWGTTGRIEWLASDQADHYQVELAADAGFSRLLDRREVREPRYTSPQLAPGEYHVRVRTVAADGFETLFSLPVAWKLAPVPDMGTMEATANTRPVLQWPAMAEGWQYDLQVASDEAFTTLVFAREGLTATSCTLEERLNPGTYHVRLRGTVNGQPQTPWTPPQQLTVKPKPLGWEELLMGVVALGIILL